MKKYDYYEAVKSDIKQWLEDNEGYYLHYSDYDTYEDFTEDICNKLWIEDSVTGNASGSYTFNTWEAEENLCHNMDLLQEALETFGCGIEYLERGAEACDVTIRCYLLGEAIAEVLEEAGGEEAFLQAKEEEEE